MGSKALALAMESKALALAMESKALAMDESYIQLVQT
jgi:hypothetical protein